MKMFIFSSLSPCPPCVFFKGSVSPSPSLASVFFKDIVSPFLYLPLPYVFFKDT